MRCAIRICSSSVSCVASRVWLGVGWYTGTGTCSCKQHGSYDFTSSPKLESAMGMFESRVPSRHSHPTCLTQPIKAGIYGRQLGASTVSHSRQEPLVRGVTGERFGPPSAGAAAAGRRRPPGRCGPAPGRAAPRPPAAAAGPRCPRPRCRPLPYLIWRRRLLIRLSPVSVASSVRLGLVEQRDVIRGGGLEAVPHLPGGSAAPPPPPPAPDPRPQPPRRSAQPAAAPPGRLMPAPALSGLAAAARPPPALAPQPPRPPSQGGGRTGLPPPVGQRAPVGPPAPRLPGAVLLPGHQLPAHWALSHGPPWLLLSPLPAGPGEQPRGLAGLRAPRPRRGDSPARPRRNEAGQDGLGDPAACWAPPAPKWWEPLRSAPERGVCLCSGHGGAGGRSGPAGRDRAGWQRDPRTTRPAPPRALCGAQAPSQGLPPGGSPGREGFPRAGRWRDPRSTVNVGTGHLKPRVEQNQHRYRMLGIWSCLKKCRLLKCQKRPAFHGGLTETEEEAEVHVWPCTKTDCTCESSEEEELLPVMPGFLEVGVVEGTAFASHSLLFCQIGH
ncbi:basic proline-rich protein-like [Passer domesticus]|uniref:basic proline-rich protein-like n=1 Tax=Passer domesticus TaxID=48849 RepID=UPI0030FE2EDB